jgi:AraC family transcriptional regulator of adaptative response / DNA-3-methyladenine glycosylase II
VLGQQVTVEAGRRLVQQLARTCGTSVQGVDPGLTLAFPTAAQVARADLAALGTPDARRRAVVAVAKAALADPLLFQACKTVEDTVEKLRAIRGVGAWTASYIAIRAAGEPDAFPADDVVLQRNAATNATDLLARAQAWRPWRAYAAQHLWARGSS